MPYLLHVPVAGPLPPRGRFDPATRIRCCDIDCRHNMGVTDAWLEDLRERYIQDGYQPDLIASATKRLTVEDLCQDCGGCKQGFGINMGVRRLGHCSCAMCEGCGRTHSLGGRRICTDCRRCSNTCSCFACQNCGVQASQTDSFWCSHEHHQSGGVTNTGSVAQAMQLLCFTCCSNIMVAQRDRIRREEEEMAHRPPYSPNASDIRRGPNPEGGVFPVGAASTFRPGAKAKKWPIERCVALEIEVCGHHPPPNATLGSDGTPTRADLYKNLRKLLAIDPAIKCVADGSLPNGGYELNTVPSSGDKLMAQLTAIHDALKLDRAFVNNKAGLHCHVDTRDLTFEHLRNLLKLYVKLEDSIFSLVEPERRGGHWSQKVGNHLLYMLEEPTVGLGAAPPRTPGLDPPRRPEVKLTKEQFNALPKEKQLEALDWKMHYRLYGQDKLNADGARHIADAKQAKGTAHYWALNIHSHFFRGSVEFRHHQGTVDKSNWLNWSLMCASIVESAKTMTWEAVDAVTPDLDGLKSIMPTPYIKTWIQNRHDAY